MSDEKPKALDISRFLTKVKTKSAEEAGATPSEFTPEKVNLPVENPSQLASRPSVMNATTRFSEQPPSEQTLASKAQTLVAQLPAKMQPHLNQLLTNQLSQQGTKQERLNVIQKEARLYPRGAFGVDEIYLFCESLLNQMRSHLAKAKAHSPTFTLALKIVGAARQDLSVHFDGTQLKVDWERIPEETTALVTVESDTAIDSVRGCLGCAHTQLRPSNHYQGEQKLLYLLGLKRYHVDDEEIDELLSARPEDNGLQAMKAGCQEAIRLVQKTIAARMERFVPFHNEPVMVRARCIEVAGEPATELLFHIENKKLSLMRGKVGETLAPGSVELLFHPLAIEALWQTQCHLNFLIISHHVEVSGDLQLAKRLGILTFETLRRVQHRQTTGQGPSRSNPLNLQ